MSFHAVKPLLIASCLFALSACGGSSSGSRAGASSRAAAPGAGGAHRAAPAPVDDGEQPQPAHCAGRGRRRNCRRGRLGPVDARRRRGRSAERRPPPGASRGGEARKAASVEKELVVRAISAEKYDRNSSPVSPKVSRAPPIHSSEARRGSALRLGTGAHAPRASTSSRGCLTQTPFRAREACSRSRRAPPGRGRGRRRLSPARYGARPGASAIRRCRRPSSRAR